MTTTTTTIDDNDDGRKKQMVENFHIKERSKRLRRWNVVIPEVFE